jgi:hypothetical protein
MRPAAQSDARIVFYRYRGFESNSNHGCLSAFILFVLSFVGSGLATG